MTALYENNRITTLLGLSVSYAATAKINATARLRYSHARLATTQAAQAGTQADTTDVVKGASIGATYDITRAWNLGCDVAHETRDVSGFTAYKYKARTVGCVTRFVWR